MNRAVDSILCSVIVSNYNYRAFVGNAIESVLKQSYGCFELLLVDDASTDNSTDIMSSFSDSRCRVFAHSKNRGQAAAFNTGFGAVHGEIVCFLDSDDWWKPEKLESVVRWHKETGADYGVLQHNMTVWQDGVEQPYKRILPTGDCFAQMEATDEIDFFVPTSGLAFRKTVLDQVFPIPESLRICADAYLMRTAFTFGPVHSIPRSLGYYRKHRNTVYGNPSFNHNGFFCSTVMPAINAFYERRGIAYRMAMPSPLQPLRSPRHRAVEWVAEITRPLRSRMRRRP